MQGLGYDYREIAAQTGSTRRTVERNLLRARQGLAHLGSSPPDE
jgi:DNA-directed RNA polymerase specialized sigma24 family protein